MSEPGIRTAWGPDGKRGAFSLTFDNLGEAADLELGRHLAGTPLGQHFTVTEVLPQWLKALEQMPISYFIEASNCAIYPEQIKSIRDAGHDIGIHAWRHEHWGKQNAAQRRDILARSLAAFEAIGIRPKGFRAPGGVMPEGANQELLDFGLSYSSPLGPAGVTTMDHGLAILPFAWKHVDAYMLQPSLGAMRASFGDPEEPVDFDTWLQVLDDSVTLALQGRHVTMIFHPSMFGRVPERFDALRRLIRTLQSQQQDLWLAPCAQVADWLHRQ